MDQDKALDGFIFALSTFAMVVLVYFSYMDARTIRIYKQEINELNARIIILEVQLHNSSRE